MKLNPEQQAAVDTNAPRVLVIAGAGSGKTLVLTERLQRLATTRGLDTRRMLAVTFTRDAARNMRRRFLERCPMAYPPEFRTLHSWYTRVLRQHARHIHRTPRFSIYDQRDREDLLRACAEDLGKHRDPWGCRLSTIEKNRRVVSEYTERLREADALDFEQLEVLALELMTTNEDVRREVSRYSHIAVDEYQDTNAAQALILAKLDPLHLFVVGDPRQAIYGFRGASVDHILGLARSANYEVVQLTRNYRSTPGVVSLANHIMAAPFRPMTADRLPVPGGGVARMDEHDSDEANIAIRADLQRRHGSDGSWSDATVLGRTWRELRSLDDLLRADGIPTIFLGAADDPWEDENGRGLARALLLLCNPSDMNLARLVDKWGSTRSRVTNHRRLREVALRTRTRMVDLLALEHSGWAAFSAYLSDVKRETGIHDAIAGVVSALFGPGSTIPVAAAHLPDDVETLGDFREWWVDRGITERKAVADEQGREGVTLVTVHGSKGLEYPHCYVLSAVEGVYPSRRNNEPKDDEEDRRLLYVATTRARDRVTLVAQRMDSTPWGASYPAGPSRWIREFPITDDEGADSDDIAI